MTIPRTRFVVLSGGRNDYPRQARTHTEPPRVAKWTDDKGREHTMISWIGGPGWSKGPWLKDYEGHNGSGTVMAREISSYEAEKIEAIEAEIKAAEEALSKLRRDRVEACERAAHLGHKVRL